MDFTTTKATILKWINSCDTLEQMHLCSDAVDFFIIDRFAAKVDVMVFSQAIYELHEAMHQREVEIVKSNILFLNLTGIFPTEEQAN